MLLVFHRNTNALVLYAYRGYAILHLAFYINYSFFIWKLQRIADKIDQDIFHQLFIAVYRGLTFMYVFDLLAFFHQLDKSGILRSER